MTGRIVIIPALNEAESIGTVLEGLANHAPDSDVVVVDDGSRDATAEVAFSCCAIVTAQRLSRWLTHHEVVLAQHTSHRVLTS